MTVILCIPPRILNFVPATMFSSAFLGALQKVGGPMRALQFSERCIRFWENVMLSYPSIFADHWALWSLWISEPTQAVFHLLSFTCFSISRSRVCPQAFGDYTFIYI